MNSKYVKYSDAVRLIERGDVLMFRGFSLVSFLISGYTDTNYTHVAIANKYDMVGKPYCESVQFREFKGGVSQGLWRDVEKNSGRVDVYRPEKFYSDFVYDEEEKTVKEIKRELDVEKTIAVMKDLMGEEYGYAQIFILWLRALPVFRFFSPKSTLRNLEPKRIRFPVCSSSIAWAFYKGCGYYLLKKNPLLSTPGDISESGKLSYLFTLVKG